MGKPSGNARIDEIALLERILRRLRRTPVERRILGLLLRELDGIESGAVGLLQEQQVAAFIHDADGHLHIAFLHLGLRGCDHGLDRREVQVLLARQVGGAGEDRTGQQE